MEQVFDLYGVESEHHSRQREIIRPGDHMMGGHFPHLPDDGAVITFDRDTALVHEDTQYLTWDHPMVTSAIDMVTSGEFGNSALSVIRHRQLPAGTSLLELLYRLDCPSPSDMPVKKYIAEPVIRLLLDINGNNHASLHPHESLTELAMQVEKHISKLINRSKSDTQQQLQKILELSVEAVNDEYGGEIRRLESLSQYNTNISESDIQLMKDQQQALVDHLTKTEARLDAIRLIVVSD